MKIVKLFFGLMLISVVVQAQPPRHEHDTTMFGFNQARAALINAPVLRGTGEGMTITPIRQQFCFDMTVDIDMFFGGRVSRQTTLFINTTDGYIGYTMPSVGGPITELLPEIESFVFTVTSFKLGNIFSYHNRKSANQGGAIEHLVSTSNSESHDTQINNTLVGSLLSRKGQVRQYCDGKAQAVNYKIDGQATEWYLYGNAYPATIKIEKILGLFGVGIARTNAGIFMIMEMQSGATHVAIKQIERRHVCFDPSGFKMMEADFYTKQTASLQEESRKIDRDEEQVQRATCCISERMAEINFRREQLRINQENLRKAQQGNLIQDRNAQTGMLSLLDPLVSVQSIILSTKTSICALHNDMIVNPTNAVDDIGKMHCLNGLLSDLLNAQTQMQRLATQYANNIAVANAQEARIYLEVMNRGGCN